MQNSDDQFASSDDRIDVVCDSYESAWLSGIRPSVDVYLDQARPEDRRALFAELLLLDYEYSRRSGQPWKSEEYARRYPQYAGEVEALGFVGHWDDTVIEDRKAPSAAPIGQRRFSRFELIEKVGAGAFGEVWKARDNRLQRTVALKIPRGIELNEQDLRRFLREARAAAQLRHPHIVSIYEAGREGADAYIVSDFIDGESLKERLTRGPLTAEAAAQLCALVADALHYAHTSGVIHRDVKPANVLLDAQLKPYLADFGLAAWSADAHELTLTGQLIGTPSYMSPEQAAGAADRIDGRADVFSLGVMLYEMLVGERPFRGDPAATVQAILNAEPERPRSRHRRIPRDLETICLKALEKNPDRRYATAQAMAADLRRFMKGEPVLARRAGPLRKGWTFARRRPAAVVAALLLLVAVSATTLAARAARQNRQLLGFRTVSIETEPRGARVAFVPLNKANWEADVASAVRAGDEATVVTELKPGDYLVVAALPDGRFHEVYRHVPDPFEVLPGAHAFRRSSIDDEGTVELPRIEIPPSTVIDSMAYLTGSNDFAFGDNAANSAPRQRRTIAPFFVDQREMTVANCPSRGDAVPSFPQREPDEPITVRFDWAVRYAEDSGKRLPTEAEYEYAATVGGTSPFPWGDELNELQPGTSRPAPFDRHVLDARLQGLSSGLAEWTISRDLTLAGVSQDHAEVLRVVRGGDLGTVAGDLRVTVESRNPRRRYFLKHDRAYPGVGFRCVRSAAPLISYDDM